MSSSLFLVAFVKESISIHDSADLVGKIANSFPNIIPTTIAETKSTSTSVIESLNRGIYIYSLIYIYIYIYIYSSYMLYSIDILLVVSHQFNIEK